MVYDEHIEGDDFHVVDEFKSACGSGEMEAATNVECCETHDDNLGRYVESKVNGGHTGEVIGGEARDDHVNYVYVNQVHVKAQVEGTNASFRENDKLASDVDVVVEGL